MFNCVVDGEMLWLGAGMANLSIVGSCVVGLVVGGWVVGLVVGRVVGLVVGG